MKSLSEQILHISGIETRPNNELVEALKTFNDGQVLIRYGQEKDSDTYCGKIYRVIVPDLTENKITIICSQWYKRILANESTPAGWQEISIPPEGIEITFEFDWFRMPKGPTEKRPIRKMKFATRTNNRCWLCPKSDPAHDQLFRAMLLLMFCKETIDQERITKKMTNNLRIFLIDRSRG